MLCKYLKDYAPERIKSVELLFPVVGHSFLPPDRVFAQIEKNIKKNEVITNPQDYYKIFNEHGTVLKLGSEIIVQDWKEASTEILKGTNAMHFSIKQCKRFFIKRNKQKLNVLVRAEESYHNALGTYKNICKKNKTVSLINPKNKHMNVAVKKEKRYDVIKFLKAHYGDQWELLPDLEYYKNVIQRSISDNSISYSNERCEMEEELPNLII
ncbi:unnamed protein product [Arctia plantaginis]|uniref:Uncharacterized protein n=1 Tax=Arctia plantaginis TaxID=874455 RepID=A0A8S0ZHB8_ARCPL|nr:unnamed protein product [Arctia plantaginis]